MGLRGSSAAEQGKMERRILVIEDDAETGQLIASHLGEHGFTVKVEHAGERGLRHAAEDAFDLVILDGMLPDMDGLEICRQLRAAGNRVPIVMLAARDSEMDRVLGLEMGADDYLAKPFGIMELCARVKALFRRVDMAAGGSARDLIRLEGMSIDLGRHEVTVDGKPVVLTAKDFDLLSFLASHPGRVFTRGQLLERVWGYGHDGYQHTVNSHINRLRNKIEPDPANPKHILTVWSVGYKFRAAAVPIA